MSTTEALTSIDVVQAGSSAATSESWMMCDWAASVSTILEWAPENVLAQDDGSVQLVLGEAPTGSAYDYCSGAILSYEAASLGTWSWTAQAPVMQAGSVFGLFTYRADNSKPWIEFDFEFVGADTTQVRLNIHMTTATGEHVTLEQANGWQPIIVDLGFDASQGLHNYEITVTGSEAIFLIDGRVVGRFDSSDMPYETWITGDMKGFANLWCVDPRLEGWAGDWAYSGTPLVATLTDIDLRPGDLGIFDPAASLALNGDAMGNDIVGGLGADILNGFAGADTLTGGAGDDKLYGGDGEDILVLDAGNDLLEGGSGRDWIKVGGTTGALIDLALTAVAQDTGYGLDRIQSIQNAGGGLGADRLAGNSGANTLRGEGGNDALFGRAGADVLEGGSGNDHIDGGSGNDAIAGGDGTDRLLGGDGNDLLGLSLGDDVLDGGVGSDWVSAVGMQAITLDLRNTAAQAMGLGNQTIIGIEHVLGSASADRMIGDGGANILRGEAGNDDLDGGEGDDSLSGGEGDDTLRLSLGNDVLDGGAGGDWLLAAGSQAITVDLSQTAAQATGLGNQTIIGIENVLGGSGADRIIGNAEANVLRGEAGNDIVSGGAGSDRLDGGTGTDLLYGGLDGVRDVFVFSALSDSAVGASCDVVYDFLSGLDLLDLSGIDANVNLAGDQAFVFGGTKSIAYGAWCSASRTQFLVRLDVNGDKAADFELRLDGVRSLVENDFLL